MYNKKGVYKWHLFFVSAEYHTDYDQWVNRPIVFNQLKYNSGKRCSKD